MNSFLSKQSPGCENINKTEYHKVFIGWRKERKKLRHTWFREFGVVFFFCFVHTAIAESITFSLPPRKQQQSAAQRKASSHAIFHPIWRSWKSVWCRKCDVKHWLPQNAPLSRRHRRHHRRRVYFYVKSANTDYNFIISFFSIDYISHVPHVLITILEYTFSYIATLRRQHKLK